MRQAEHEALVAEIAAHPKSALIDALADTMQSIEDDDGNGRHISYYQSLAYATVEMLPGLFYDEDATCDEPGCGAHPTSRPSAEIPEQLAELGEELTEEERRGFLAGLSPYHPEPQEGRTDA